MDAPSSFCKEKASAAKIMSKQSMITIQVIGGCYRVRIFRLGSVIQRPTTPWKKSITEICGELLSLRDEIVKIDDVLQVEVQSRPE